MLQKDSNVISNVLIISYREEFFNRKKGLSVTYSDVRAPGGQKISDYQNMFHRSSNQVSCNHFLPP